MTRQRLQKLIAAAGLCSRRRAEEWLQAGRVTVDGQVARVGDQADPQQQTIHVDGQPLPSRGVARVLLMNKPVGVICSCEGGSPLGSFDQESQPAVENKCSGNSWRNCDDKR